MLTASPAVASRITLVHCAAVLPKSPDKAAAVEAAQENRRIDDIVLSVVSENKGALVYLSGTSVYGRAEGVCTESSPLNPDGAYIAEKVATEKHILRMDQQGIILRVSAPYGPGQRARTVLNSFVESALANRDLVVHGSGARAQDFTAVSDVARAVGLAVIKRGVRGVINIASGCPTAMIELAVLVLSLLPESTSRVVHSGQPDPQEAYRGLFDISHAKADLGWHPTISLPDGLRELIRYRRLVR